MTDDVGIYLKGAAEQLYRAALETMSRTREGDFSPKDLKETVAALRELMALRELLSAESGSESIHVVFEGGEEAWSR